MRPPTFPLLGKELVELAARRRTYIIRVLYAVLFFGFFALFGSRFFSDGFGVQGMLGSGRFMFDIIIGLQFFGIFIFLPAMMSGSLTYEKERDSLALLFLTDLTPWEIILQKYIAGLVPMLSFLMLSMPITAVAYAFGGVSQLELFSRFLALLVTCLQVGAFALLCSAFCRTTPAAFIASYLLGAAFYFGPALVSEFGSWLLFGHGTRWDEQILFAFFPPIALGSNSSEPAGTQALRLVVILFSAAVFLSFARFFLPRRAFLPAGNPLFKLFRRLDVFMQKANRFTGNILLARGEARMPGYDPVAWRELTKRSLGHPSHLFRILVAIELPVVAICFFQHATRVRYSDDLAMLAFALWGIAFLLLVVQAANTIVSERVNQTLDVLLTTSLSGSDIVRQKWRALRRLCLILAIPLLTITATQTSWLGWHYALCGVFGVVIYLPLIAWGALYIGLRSRTRFRAILTALGVGIGWCVLPGLVILIWMSASNNWDFSEILVFTGPASIVLLNEQNGLRHLAENDSLLGLIILNFACYGAVLLFIRWRCLASADQYLRR